MSDGVDESERESPHKSTGISFMRSFGPVTVAFMAEKPPQPHLRFDCNFGVTVRGR